MKCIENAASPAYRVEYRSGMSSETVHVCDYTKAADVALRMPFYYNRILATIFVAISGPKFLTLV